MPPLSSSPTPFFTTAPVSPYNAATEQHEHQQIILVFFCKFYSENALPHQFYLQFGRSTPSSCDVCLIKQKRSRGFRIGRTLVIEKELEGKEEYFLMPNAISEVSGDERELAKAILKLTSIINPSWLSTKLALALIKCTLPQTFLHEQK